MYKLTHKLDHILILLIILLTGVITYPSTQNLLLEWTKWDQALSQGFACLGLLAFFIWRLPLIKSQEERPVSFFWCFLLMANSLGWCLVQLGNLQLLAYIATFCLIILALINAIGFRATQNILPLICLLLFALPLWSGQFLVEMSSWAVGLILKLFNLTLHIQDNLITTPWGTIVIADGCSGLRYLIISLLLAYLLWLLNAYSFKTGIMIMVIAFILGVLTNWIRITLLVLIGYHTEMTHSLVRDHEFFGWVLFAFILFPALYFAPQKKINPQPLPIRLQVNLWIFLAWLCGPVWYFLTPFNAADINPISFNLQDKYAEAWAKPGLFLQYPPKTTLINKGIDVHGTTVHLELMRFNAQRKDEKVVPYMGNIYDEYQWRQLSVHAHSQARIETLEQRHNPQRVLLAYRYQVGPWTTASYTKAKLLQIPAKLTGQAYFGFWSAQIICASDCVSEMPAMQELSQHW
jgi:exosortase